MKPNPVKAWSFSRLQTYELCPAKFKYKFIDKLEEEASPAMERGRQIHKEGERFLLEDGVAVPDSYQLFHEEIQELASLDVFAEQQWGFNRRWRTTGWFAKDTWLRTVVDAGVCYTDDTADLVDFKTGKKWGDNSEQMELFGLAAFCRFPVLHTVTTRLWYLDVGEEDVEVFHRYQVPSLIAKWEEKVAPMFNDTAFAPRPNDKCKWCPYSRAAGGPCKFG